MPDSDGVYLRVLLDGVEQQTLSLGTRTLQVGRADSHDLVLSDPERRVSRTHAEIRFEQGRHRLYDSSSENGLWVDGVKVDRVWLDHGVEVTVGPYTLVVDVPSRASAATIYRPLPATDSRYTEPVAAQVQSGVRAKVGGRRWLMAAVVFAAIFIAAVALVRPAKLADPAPELLTAAEARLASVALDRAQRAVSSGDMGQALTALSQFSEVGGRPAEAEALRLEAAALLTPLPTLMVQMTRLEENLATPASEPASRQRAPVARSRESEVILHASALLQGGEYVSAIQLLESIPVAARTSECLRLLAQARESYRVTSQAIARTAFETGRTAEQLGDLAQALSQYQRASVLDPSLDGLAEALRRVPPLMNERGEEAFRRARLYEARGRTGEAVTQYEAAIRLLPESNPNKAAAQERLKALRLQP